MADSNGKVAYLCDWCVNGVQKQVVDIEIRHL